MAALSGAVIAAACLLAWGPGTAAAATFAGLDQPGPALDVPAAALRASLTCEPSVRDADVEPVLLNPATGVTAAQNYSWNYEPALSRLGIPWCAYTAPHSTLGDIQTSGEYLVYAIRTEYALAGRPIAIIGHSQGGMSMRWPLRFWPDTRHMVADVVGFSGSNHGTTMLSAKQCEQEGGCPPADWQQIRGSRFLQALNSGAETFAGISYTEIWTHTDEVVQPNGAADVASAALHTGGGQITDLATQDVCPRDRYEHLAIGTVDPVAYALAIDAITHPGPADPARVLHDNPGLCSLLFMPGVTPLNVWTYLEVLEGAPGLLSVAAAPAAPLTTGAPTLRAEPALACYVFAACAPVDRLRLQVSPPTAVVGRRVRLRFRVSVDVAGVVSPVPGASVYVGDGRRLRTDLAGRASTVLAFGRSGERRAVATAPEYLSVTKRIRVRRPRGGR
jgi:hypothetical protein